MFIIKNDKMCKFYENVEEVFNFFRNTKIHPDLFEIYIGEIKRIHYEDLLPKLNVEKLNEEVNLLFSKAEEKMNALEQGYIIEKNLYPNGFLENNIAGFNPVIEIKLFILAEGDIYSKNSIPCELPNKLIKEIFQYNNWEVIKIKHEGLLSKRTGWRDRGYIIYLKKNRENFYA